MYFLAHNALHRRRHTASPTYFAFIDGHYSACPLDVFTKLAAVHCFAPMTSYAASSAEADSKVLRTLADILSESSASVLVTDVIPLINTIESSGSLSVISSDDAKHLYQALTIALSSNRTSIIVLALRLTTYVARALPPVLLAAYCHPLTQKTVSLFSRDNDKCKEDLRPYIMTAVAALIAAAAPLAMQGGVHKSCAVAACQGGLRHALIALETSPLPASVAKPALAIIFAVIYTAPRELRATLAHTEQLLHDRVFVHESESVREFAAVVFAHLGISCPDRLRPASFTARLAAMCKELDQIVLLLRMFSSSSPKSRQVPKSLQPLPSTQVIYLVHSLYTAISSSVSSQLPPPTPVPIPTILSTLYAALALPEIDPYSSAPPQTHLDADGALLVANAVSAGAIDTLSVLFKVIPRDILFPHATVLSCKIRDKLAVCLLQFSSDSVQLAMTKVRLKLYDMLSSGVLTLGGILIDAILPILQQLVAMDVELRLKVARLPDIADSRQLSLKHAPPPSRKRRKLGGDSEVNGERDAATVAEALIRMFDPATISRIHASFSSAMHLVTVIFNGRTFLSKDAVNALAGLEESLLQCLRESVFSDGVLDAVSAAVAGCGSNMFSAVASPLFAECVRVSSSLSACDGLEPAMRISSLLSKSICEGLVHPRGPPLKRATRPTCTGGNTKGPLNNGSENLDRNETPENFESGRLNPKLVDGFGSGMADEILNGRDEGLNRSSDKDGVASVKDEAAAAGKSGAEGGENGVSNGDMAPLGTPHGSENDINKVENPNQEEPSDKVDDAATEAINLEPSSLKPNNQGEGVASASKEVVENVDNVLSKEVEESLQTSSTHGVKTDTVVVSQKIDEEANEGDALETGTADMEIKIDVAEKVVESSAVGCAPDASLAQNKFGEDGKGLIDDGHSGGSDMDVEIEPSDLEDEKKLIDSLCFEQSDEEVQQ